MIKKFHGSLEYIRCMKKSLIHTILFSTCLFLLQITIHAQGLTEDRFAIVEGKKMCYQTGGAGNVTVVFESGHQADLTTWDPVYAQVAKFARVVRYDRAGYRLSEVNAPPKNIIHIATRLHELLKKENIPGPYIFVGHSLGGALIRAFAHLYPEEVIGLVLVDPLTEYWGSDLSAEEKKEFVMEMDRETKADSVGMGPGGINTMYEWKLMREEYLKGFTEIHSYDPFPNVPVALFAAGRFILKESIRELYEKKIQNLPDARYIEIAQSHHGIQFYDPNLVIENIRRIVFSDVVNILRKTIAQNGIEAGVVKYRELNKTYPKEYMQENFLNALGYELLQAGDAQGAIKLFALNVEYYPESSNVYDSLGEGYMNAGNKEEAIKNYKKSLQLNPHNTNAEMMLQKMKG